MACIVCAPAAGAADPLPSWNEDARKKAILDFGDGVDEGGGSQLRTRRRAHRDVRQRRHPLDEKPIYFQFDFAIARVKALVEKHPEYRDKQPFKARLAGDIKTSSPTVTATWSKWSWRRTPE